MRRLIVHLVAGAAVVLMLSGAVVSAGCVSSPSTSQPESVAIPIPSPTESAPVQSVMKGSGPNTAPAAQIKTVPTSVPQQETPAQASSKQDSDTEADSVPVAVPVVQIKAAPTSTPQQESPAIASIEQDPVPKANSDPATAPVVQVKTALTSTAQEATAAQTSIKEDSGTASNAEDSPSMPTPVLMADDGLEFAPVDSFETSGKNEGITTVDQAPSQKSGASTGPAQGQTYTWEDGDRTLTVYLQTDLVVEKGSDGLPRDVVASNEGGTNVVRSADGQSKGDTLPVFRSESSGLMTLPGGVLLVLSAEWSQAETNAFFSNNGIKMDRVSELGYVANGYFIETEPGFPSLDLANELAALDGVEVSSPNWGRERFRK